MSARTTPRPAFLGTALSEHAEAMRANRELAERVDPVGDMGHTVSDWFCAIGIVVVIGAICLGL